MMDNKFAIIIDNSNKIEKERQVNKTIHTLGFETDRYIYINETENYNMTQEIDDLRKFYKGVYIL